MDTDNQLLESYVSHRSERAFRELVERHINLVHSAALREARGDASYELEIKLRDAKANAITPAR